MTDTSSPLSRIPTTIRTEKDIVISVYTDILESLSETSLTNYLTTIPTTIPTKLVKLLKEKELTDCLNWISAHLRVNDEQAIAILKVWQRGVE